LPLNLTIATERELSMHSKPDVHLQCSIISLRRCHRIDCCDESSSRSVHT